MCNPRRLVVNLTWQIEEEVQATVTETAVARADVHERLARVIPLGDRLGPSARLGLSAALAEGFHGWRHVEGEEGRFINELGPLRLSLDSNSAELMVEIERSGSVSSTGRGEGAYRASVQANLATSKTDIAYGDGWRGRTEEVVQQELKQSAEADLAGQRQRAIEEQTRDVRDAAQRQAVADAQHQAEEQVQALGEEERTLLREELEALFQQSRPALHAEVAALVGETLRRSILHLVRVNGGELRQCEETEDSIVIEAVL